MTDPYPTSRRMAHPHHLIRCPRENRTWKELVVRATLQLAMKGNATALKEVWERLDGKTLQTERLQLGGTDGKQVLIKVVYGDQEKGSSPD